MPDPAPTMEALAARCEDALIAAGALIDGVDDADLEDVAARADLFLRDAYRAAEACQRWLLLRRSAPAAVYDPRDLPRVLSGALGMAVTRPRRDDDLALSGDIDRIVACLRVLVDNAPLRGGDTFRAELRLDDAPALLIALDGEGALPDPLLVEGLLPLSAEDFDACWAGATGGGRVMRAGSRLLLDLCGGDTPPGGESGAPSPAWDASRRLARRLRSWRGATGHYEPGLVSVAEMRTLYRDTIRAALEDLRGLLPRRAA